MKPKKQNVITFRVNDKIKVLIDQMANEKEALPKDGIENLFIKITNLSTSERCSRQGRRLCLGSCYIVLAGAALSMTKR